MVVLRRDGGDAGTYGECRLRELEIHLTTSVLTLTARL
jgi:hypothetical protein